MNRTAARRGVLALGGLALAIPFLDTRLWPLAWFGLMPLFASAPNASNARAAFVDGWVMGLAVNVPAFYWLVATMTRFGGFPLPVSLVFYAVLSSYSALQFALVALVLHRCGPSAPLVLAPVVWTCAEFLFPNLFPWRLGHSQRDLPLLMQVADLTGPYGLSFVIAWAAAAALQARSRRLALSGPTLAILGLLLYGWLRIDQIEQLIREAPAHSVGVVQGNLSLDEKRKTASFVANVGRYRELSGAIDPPPDLVVWPETVVEWGIPHEASQLGRLDPYPDAPAPLVFGALSYRNRPGRREWFNSAFLRMRDGSVGGRYDKLVLLPFGEFIPFGSIFPALYELSPATGNFTAGVDPGVLEVTSELRVATLICYEDLLASLSRAAVERGATVLLTLANDAWFGESAALRQHETLALWRAIENRRYLIRSTNTGLTGLIDPIGRSVATLKTAAPASFRAEIRSLTHRTIYQHWGDVFGYLTLSAGIGLIIFWGGRIGRAGLH